MGRNLLRAFRRMTPHELRVRSREIFVEYCQEAGHHLGLGGSLEADLLPDAGLIPFRDPWIADEDRREVVNELRSQHKPYLRQIVDASDALCRHEFSLSGTAARLDENIAWQTDPICGTAWPSEFHTRLRICDHRKHEVRHVWELNRHQFLPVLGKAYQLTGDEKYADAGLALIDSWIDANPYNIGINWTNALEVGLRTLSWGWACALFEGAASLTPPRRRRILGSLSQQARYVERRHRHLLGEATALLAIGSLNPSLRHAGLLGERGWSLVEAALPGCYHEDGGPVDQATAYHHLTLAFHIQALLIRRRVTGGSDGPVWSALERALEFSMHMTRPDGTIPMIGDVQSRRPLGFDSSDQFDFRSLLALGAVLFGRSDFKRVGGDLPPDAAWLVGRAGWRAHEALADKAPEKTSHALPSSGYYVMRSGWDAQAHYLSFDCGDVTRGHADALSIEVAAFGEPLIVDPGSWPDQDDPEWHRYFRETEAHNTVVIDRQSQVERGINIQRKPVPQVHAHTWVTLAGLDYAEGSHSSYERLASPVTHRRAVVFLKPGYWVVRDELTGSGEHDIDRCFHLATPDAVRDPASHGVQTRQTDGRPNLTVVPVERQGVTLELARGGPATPRGWLAPGGDRKLQAAIATYGAKTALPCAFHTLIVPFRGGSPWVRVNVRSIESDAESPVDRAFEVFRPGGRDVWAFSSGGTARFHNNWFTDARVACVQLDDAGRVTGCALIDGSRIDIDGPPLVELDQRVRAATMSVIQGHTTIELSEPAQVVSSSRDRNVRKAG